MRAPHSACFTLAFATTVGSFSFAVHAEPPAQEDVRIRYNRRILRTKPGGGYRTSWEFMTADDMNRHANRARCLCGDRIEIEIDRVGTKVIDPGHMEALIGEGCSQSKSSNNSTYGACAAPDGYLTDSPGEWLENVADQRVPVELFANSQPMVDEQVATHGASEVALACGGNQGSGGVWMCFGASECQNGNFFMQGDWSDNSNNAQQSGQQMGMNSGGSSASGVRYDFRGPVNPPKNIAVAATDSSVEISWELQSSADLGGFRVLCADLAGNPIEQSEAPIDLDKPAAAYANLANIYFTPRMYCPDVDLGIVPDADDSTGTTGDPTVGFGSSMTQTDLTGTGGADMTTGADPTGTGSTGYLGYPAQEEDDDDGEEEDEEGEDEDVVDDGGVDEGVVDVSDDLTSSDPWAHERKVGFEALDWAYICSEHIDPSSNSARIEGLSNDKTYQFILVAYDEAGNPTPSGVFQATPINTHGPIGECDLDEDYRCGQLGFCRVGGTGPLGALGLAGLFLVGGMALRLRKSARTDAERNRQCREATR